MSTRATGVRIWNPSISALARRGPFIFLWRGVRGKKFIGPSIKRGWKREPKGCGPRETAGREKNYRFISGESERARGQNAAGAWQPRETVKKPRPQHPTDTLARHKSRNAPRNYQRTPRAHRGTLTNLICARTDFSSRSTRNIIYKTLGDFGPMEIPLKNLLFCLSIIFILIEIAAHFSK